MSEYQEFTGKSVEEALRIAREAFGVTGLDDLDFEILTPGSRGVLGMGAEPARIVAAPRSSLSGRTASPSTQREPASPAPAPADVPDRAPADQRVVGPTSARPDRPDRPHAAETYGRPSPETSAPGERPSAGPSRARPAGDTGPSRPPRPQEARRTSALSTREADEVANARASVSVDKDEIQAAEASPEALEAGREILETLVALMGYPATVSVSAGTTSKISVDAVDEAGREALGALIGRKGERLSALQHLVNLMLSRKMGAWTRVLVDIEDYRGRRERQVIEVARRAAEKVLQTGTMLQLEPMTALERRWVHIALRGIEGVATQSIGEEPSRRIVVLRV